MVGEDGGDVQRVAGAGSGEMEAWRSFGASLTLRDCVLTGVKDFPPSLPLGMILSFAK